MSPLERPVFKYHPVAFESGAFIVSDATCPVCQRQTGWSYEGPVFSTRETTDHICPWCLADGRAATFFDAEFADAGASETVQTAGAMDELAHRTPGYSSWQSPVWIEHCGDYCALLGEAGPDQLRSLATELSESLDDIAAEIGAAVEDLFEADLSISIYLFRCLHCRQHRLHWDST